MNRLRLASGVQLDIESLASQLRLFEEHGSVNIVGEQRFTRLLAVADVVEGIDDFDALWSCHGTAVFLSSLRCFVHQGRKGYPIMQLMCNICAGLVDGIHLK